MKSDEVINLYELLKKGLTTSKTVALIVTPESLNSEWVEDEYHRALQLSNQGCLQLIPLVLRERSYRDFFLIASISILAMMIALMKMSIDLCGQG